LEAVPGPGTEFSSGTLALMSLPFEPSQRTAFSFTAIPFSPFLS